MTHGNTVLLTFKGHYAVWYFALSDVYMCQHPKKGSVFFLQWSLTLYGQIASKAREDIDSHHGSTTIAFTKYVHLKAIHQTHKTLQHGYIS